MSDALLQLLFLEGVVDGWFGVGVGVALFAFGVWRRRPLFCVAALAITTAWSFYLDVQATPIDRDIVFMFGCMIRAGFAVATTCVGGLLLGLVGVKLAPRAAS